MKLARQIVLLTVVCIVAIGFTHMIRGQHVGPASGTFKEFMIIRAERSESRIPTPFERLVVEAQRADGSRMEGQLTQADPPRAERRHIWLVPEGVRAEVDDSLRANTTLYFKDRPAPAPSVPDPQCGFSRLSPAANPRYLGEVGEVLGIRTVAIQTEQRLGSESVLNTVWRAPDLDCAVLKMTEDRRDETGITGHFEMQVVKVLVGTPEPRLFEVPLDYTEVSPSQMANARIASAGRPMPPGMRQRLEQQDQQYLANHQSAGIR